MRKKIYVLFDTPEKKCDKLWVAQELSARGYNVKISYSAISIFELEQKGKIGKLFAKGIIFLQCLFVLLRSSSNDVVFCWNNWTGIVLNMLTKNRWIISYNWLTPHNEQKRKEIYAGALNNPKLAAVINEKDNYKKLLEVYGAEDRNNIYFIPDVYNSTQEFLQSEYDKDKKYCFMGGIENRNWDQFMEVAEQCPTISFIGVLTQKEVELLDDIPSNVEIHVDISMDEYYRLMKQAFLCICLLKEDRASGLINILRSIQLGKIMLVTKTKASSMYYAEENKDFLLPQNDIEVIANTIKNIYLYSDSIYVNTVNSMQQFIEEHFSPKHAINEVEKIMDKMN